MTAKSGILGHGWRVIGASVCGPAHTAAGRSREDAFGVATGAECAAAVVCDGAGTATRAEAGATAFSSAVANRLRATMTAELSLGAFQAAVIRAVEECRSRIVESGSALRDHHATLVAVVTTPQRTLIAHVGDGLAGVSPNGEWRSALMSLPQNGEFANETFFLTEDAWDTFLRCTEAPPISKSGAAVLMSDGAMPFVIGSSSTGLEPDFMTPVSKFLRDTDPSVASEALCGTLDSAAARKISSDDKTLIWIGREDD